MEKGFAALQLLSSFIGLIFVYAIMGSKDDRFYMTMYIQPMEYNQGMVMIVSAWVRV